MNVQTVFGQPSAPASLQSDLTVYTLSMMFSLSEDAALTGIWFYSAPDGSLPTTCGIFKSNGDGTGSIVVTNTSPSWSGVAGSGWVKCTFDGSVTLTADTNYRVSLLGGGSNWYSGTASYWTTGPGASGITNGIITAPNDTTAKTNDSNPDIGQDAFCTSATYAYANDSFGGANYWIDVEVTTGLSTVTGTGSVKVKKMSLSGSGFLEEFGSGSVNLKKMSVSGSGIIKISGTGSVVVPKMYISGTGQDETISGTGSVRLKKMIVSGSGKTKISGTGSVAIPKMNLRGQQIPLEASALFIFTPV